MRLHRHQLLELEDFAWFPKQIRDGVTDYLQHVLHVSNVYCEIAPRLRAALDRVGARQVVDLCSGGGGPWLELQEALGRQGDPVAVLLTDLYPNREAYARFEQSSQGRIIGCPHSVDATAVPARLDGFRTIFTGLHHFPPATARAILADAVAQRRGIGVFECTERTLLGVFTMLFTPLLCMLITPRLRPFRWSRLFWTYVVPLIPLIVGFDGVMSCLRTYTVDELRAMVAGLDDDGYHWEIGRQPFRGTPFHVTYLIGYPVERA